MSILFIKQKNKINLLINNYVFCIIFYQQYAT